MLSKIKVLSQAPLKYKSLHTQCVTGFMQAEASSSTSPPLALKTLFRFKLYNFFGSYRCVRSLALAGVGFLCIGYRGPCQRLRSAGCGGCCSPSAAAPLSCLLAAHRCSLTCGLRCTGLLLLAAPTPQCCCCSQEQT